jgi:hypothetical protein
MSPHRQLRCPLPVRRTRIGTMPSVAAAQQAAFLRQRRSRICCFQQEQWRRGGGEPIVLQLPCVVATRIASLTKRQVRTCKPSPMACRSHLASNDATGTTIGWRRARQARRPQAARSWIGFTSSHSGDSARPGTTAGCGSPVASSGQFITNAMLYLPSATRVRRSIGSCRSRATGARLPVPDREGGGNALHHAGRSRLGSGWNG